MGSSPEVSDGSWSYLPTLAALLRGFVRKCGMRIQMLSSPAMLIFKLLRARQ